MGKKVKKAVKRLTKPLGRAYKSAIGSAVKSPKMPVSPDHIPPAVEVAAPKEDAETDTGKDTESGKRKTQSRGKSKLTVARSSGRGLNF